MTAVMFARTQAEADEAAFNLGLTSWIWPRTGGDLAGVVPELIVYVDGWREGVMQNTDAGYSTAMRAALHDAEELEQPTTAGWVVEPFAKFAAAAELADRRRRAKLGSALTASPFVDPGTIQPTLRPRRRRSWISRLLRRRP